MVAWARFPLDDMGRWDSYVEYYRTALFYYIFPSFDYKHWHSKNIWFKMWSLKRTEWLLKAEKLSECEVWKTKFHTMQKDKPFHMCVSKGLLSQRQVKSLGPRLSFCPALKRGRPRPLPWRDVRGAAGLERGEPPTGGRRRSPQEPGTPAGGRPGLSGRCSGRCGASPPL